MLNLIDEFTHECLAIRVDRKLKSADVIDVLSDQFHPHRRRSVRRAACSGALSSTTRPSTPAGSTWLRSRSACSKANVSIAASIAATASWPRSMHGRHSETKSAPASPGCSPPTVYFLQKSDYSDRLL